MTRLIMAFAAAGILVSPGVRAAGTPALELRGTGVQIYACTAGAWKLKAPDATLTDKAGKVVGHHFAGPSWQAADGSRVVGALVSASPSPEKGAIPWLVVRAASNTGDGLFGRVAFIARTETSGGAAPAAPCQTGNETRISYAATYIFFTP